VSDDRLLLYGPCPTCGLVASDMERRTEGGGASGSWRCLRCGHQYGVWLDGGELDLSIIRDSELNRNGPFRETFE
jgi:Zn-finger nucleic acid-binding protein